MMRRLAMLVLVASVAWVGGAHGQGNTSYAPIELTVACGALSWPSCAVALPKIAARAVQSGIALRPIESAGPLSAVAAVCEGKAAAALVPRDALARKSECAGRYDVIARPIYPYYAFLVVKADAPFRTLDDMASGVPDRQKRTIAAASGGQMTIDALLRYNPGLERAIAVTNDGLSSALDRIANNTIDGFFAMETLNSDLIDRVRLRTDAGGQKLFRFIDVRAGLEFLRTGDGAGHCVYRVTALDFGGRTPVTTISVDAVMVLGQSYHDAHARSGPKAPEALSSAIAATQQAMLSDMKSPRDWRPTLASCK